MISESEFLSVVHIELGLPVGGESTAGLDRPIRWDSLTVLRLVAALERRGSKRLPVGQLLRKPTLKSLYDSVAAAA